MSDLDLLDAFARDLSRVIAGPAGFSGFEDLALELFRRQFSANPAYRRWCERRGVIPSAVRSWRDIPAVPTVAFKELEMTSLPRERRSVTFHSSGTTGQAPSRHFHDERSLAVYELSLSDWFDRHFPTPRESPRYLSLTPPPGEAPHSSLVHMFQVVGRRGFDGSCLFAGRLDAEGVWQVDSDRYDSAVAECRESRRPVLLLGTAFHFVHLLESAERDGRSVELPSGSYVLETGGYKGRVRERPRAELRAAMARQLGIPDAAIVGEYGMSELSSQAYDGVAGTGGSRRFRFPPWARAVVVSPETGREAAPGEAGLLKVLDLANVWSAMAVQTEDRAEADEDGFRLLGRAPATEPRGCSLMAPA